jgi:di/tricarboxylate transporter
MVLVLTIVFLAVVLFIWEPIRIDFVALSIPLLLVLFKPWTTISTTEALSGFASEATLTVLAMFVLSEGIRRSGAMQILSRYIVHWTGRSEARQVGIVSAIAGSIAGFINNTPVVSIFIPTISNIASNTRTSPSRLLIPLSYAAMLGGMVTVLGTSTNLLASDISDRLIGRPFTLFEFAELGLIILVVGLVYLVLVGRFLLPERIDPRTTLGEEFHIDNFLTEVIIDEDSPFVGGTIETIEDLIDRDVNVVQINGESTRAQELRSKTLEAGDHLYICNNDETVYRVVTLEGVTLIPGFQMSTEEDVREIDERKLVQTVVSHGEVEGETLRSFNFTERYNCPVIAIRRGEKILEGNLDEILLEAGDVLLVLATDETLRRLYRNRNFIVAHEFEPGELRQGSMWGTFGILGAVILAAAMGWLPIAIAALAGMVAMVAAGSVQTGQVYEAIDWEVIFLLAGLIPLGKAFEQTGTAQYLAMNVLEASSFLPAVVILGIFYLLTAGVTNVISNNASVVLMVPIAVDAATQIGADPFSFILAVTFGASTAFLTPVGYQTNLMVYGPGGYRFYDYFIVGLPLQLILTFVIPTGIFFIWGV